MDLARIDSHLPSSPKVIAAGFWGAQLYLHLLLLNRAQRCGGLIPTGYCAPDYLARYLGLEAAPYLAAGGAEIVRFAIRAAAQAGLVAVEAAGLRILDAQDWESDSAPRVRRHRAKLAQSAARKGSRAANRAGSAAPASPEPELSPGCAESGDSQGDGQTAGSAPEGASEARRAPAEDAGDSARDLVVHLQEGGVTRCNVTVTPPLPSFPPPLFSPPQTPPLISPAPHPSRPSDSDPGTLECNVTDVTPEWGATPEVFALEMPGQKAPKKARKPVDPAALKLAGMLLAQVRIAAPSTRVARVEGAEREALIARWAEPIAKLHTVDHAPWESIEGTLQWVARSDFWGTNILSGEALRRGWDKIQAQRDRESRSARSSSGQHRIVDVQRYQQGERKL